MGERDPAQPLLTLHEGAARVELSGATTANWVAKDANLLHDGCGGPDRVGLLLPLHWQTVALLLGGITAGASVVVGRGPEDLDGCGVAFTTCDRAAEVLDAGVEEVYAVSTAPLGGRAGPLPPMVLDHGLEAPSYGDTWSGPRPSSWQVMQDGTPLVLPPVALRGDDRVLLAGGVDALPWLLAALAAGAAVVLAPLPGDLDLRALAAEERVTSTVGADLAGLRRLDGP